MLRRTFVRQLRCRAPVGGGGAALGSTATFRLHLLAGDVFRSRQCAGIAGFGRCITRTPLGCSGLLLLIGLAILGCCCRLALRLIGLSDARRGRRFPCLRRPPLLLHILRRLPVLTVAELGLRVVPPHIAAACVDAVIVLVDDDIAVLDVYVSAPVTAAVVVIVVVVVVVVVFSSSSPNPYPISPPMAAPPKKIAADDQNDGYGFEYATGGAA